MFRGRRWPAKDASAFPRGRLPYSRAFTDIRPLEFRHGHQNAQLQPTCLCIALNNTSTFPLNPALLLQNPNSTALAVPILLIRLITQVRRAAVRVYVLTVNVPRVLCPPGHEKI
jgi:hypothetical protein